MVTHGLALEYFLLKSFNGNPADHNRKNGPVAFRPIITHGLAVKQNKSVKVFLQATRPTIKTDGPVAFRPTVTRGLACLSHSFTHV
jgi:hypothetical protein